MDERELQEEGNERDRSEEDGEEEDTRGEESEEVRRPRTTRRPTEPTRKEREEHKITHMPFRTWCRLCVSARGRDRHHRTTVRSELGVPLMGIDFFFLGDENSSGTIPAVVLKDYGTKAVFAHVIPAKGCEYEWTATQVVHDILKIGYDTVILRSDQEPAISAFTEKVKELFGAGAQVEWAPRGDKNANGLAERAAQAVEGVARTLKLELEERLGRSIPVTHPIVTWLVRHASDLMNKLEIKKNGKTPYEMIKGRPYRGELTAFGQKVLYLDYRKPRGGDMRKRWSEAIWVGKMWKSDEHILCTSKGVFRASTIRALAVSESWNAEDIEMVKATPWNFEPGDDMPTTSIPVQEGEMREPEQTSKPPAPRGVRIELPDIRDFGYTKGCRKCEMMRRGDKSHAGSGHDNQCRERIINLMKTGTEKQKRKVAEAERKCNDFLAGKIEEREGGDEKEDKEEEREDREEGRGATQREERQEAEEEARPKRRKVRVMESDDTATGSSDGYRAEHGEHHQPVGPEEEEEEMAQNHHGLQREEGRGRKRDSEAAGSEEQPQAKYRALEDLNILNTDKAMMWEIFSSPRLIPHAVKAGWALGQSFDSGWNFRDPKVQRRILHMISEQCPYLIVMHPPDNMAYEETMKMLAFAMIICRIQAAQNRYFIFAQSTGATSWWQESMRQVRRMPGVEKNIIDACAYGMRSYDEQGQAAARNQVGILSNMPAINCGLDRKCKGGHRHLQHVNQRGDDDTINCVDGYCKEVMRCAEIQRMVDWGEQKLCATLSAEGTHRGSGAEQRPSQGAHELHDTEEEKEWRQYIDDRNGETLEGKAVRRARRKEVETLREHKVYDKVPLRIAQERMARIGTKIIEGRWLDTNKAAVGLPPDIRSRYVAKEFVTTSRDDLFAGTPSLETAKLMISMAASGGRRWAQRVMVMDVKRAFLHAPTQREVYIRLPAEDMEGDSESMVGRLRKALYGTRDAPQSWQAHITAVMRKLGFAAGRANPCLFRHRTRDLTVSVHVDDFLCLGSPGDLTWLRSSLKNDFDYTSAVLGGGVGEVTEVKYLNRTITYTAEGLVYEPDVKHVQTVLDELGLRQGKGVNTPGLKEGRKEDDDIPLCKKGQQSMRRLIAVLNYLAQDRCDLGFSVKECARMMSNPCRRTSVAIQRLARYLIQFPSRPQLFRWQEEPSSLAAYTDADWAGCERTRRSTSGGMILHGHHMVKHWSRTQIGVSLSSGEAELVALVKASSEVLGMRNTCEEMGKSIRTHVLTDSSAAKGAVQRVGVGRMKHIATQSLWVQEKAARNEIKYIKVNREFNFADLLTHHWNSPAGEKMFHTLGIQRHRS